VCVSVRPGKHSNRWSGEDAESVIGHLKDQVRHTFVGSDEYTVGSGLSKRMDWVTVLGLF